MAPKKFSLFLAIASFCILFRAASAQTSCTASILSLAPCLGYITGTETSPSASCCTGLSSVVKSSPECLCQVLKGGASQFGITVNQTQALQLPTACSVITPPVSACDAVSTPPSPSTTPTNSTSSPGGSTTVAPPTITTIPDNGSSGRTTLSLGFVFLFVTAAVALAV